MEKYNKGFLNAMKLSKGVIGKSRNADAGRVWLSVKEIVCSGDYYSYKKAGTLSELTLGGYDDSYIAANLGISENTLRVHRRNISIELFKIFGNDFFELLNDFSNNESEIRRRLKVAQHRGTRAEDLLPLEVIAMIRSKDIIEETFDLADCKLELVFLKKHCNVELAKSIAALDKNKLAYLLGVINSDGGTPNDRFHVLTLLTQQEDN